MAVWLIECPDCGHHYQSLVMDGTKVPTVWHCSRCGGSNAIPRHETSVKHPLEHGAGCACCTFNEASTNQT